MDKKENKTIKYSKDEGNLEVVDKKIKKQGNNYYIGTLNVFVNPIKKRHEKHYHASTFHLVADVILVLAVLVNGAYLIWVLNINPKVNIALGIASQNDNIISGSEEVFNINYENNEGYTLSNSNLTVKTPENFFITSVSPQNIFNKETNTFNIGELNPGANGKVSLTGVVFGEIDSRQVVAASLNYKEDGQEKSSLSSYAYPIEDSVIEISHSIPDEVYQGVEFTGSLNIKNAGNYDFKDVKFEFSDELKIINNNFNFKKLKAGESKKLIFQGKIESIAGTLPLFINGYNKLNIGDNTSISLKQFEIKKIIKIKEPKLDLSIRADNKIISLDGAVKYFIRFKNDETEGINSLKLKFRAQGNNYSIRNLKMISGVNWGTIKNNHIIINKALKPGDFGEIIMNASFSEQRKSINPTVGLGIESEYILGNKNVLANNFSSQTKVLSDLKVTARGAYYSPQGDQLGIGPLPPVVGIPTNYWIFFELNNYGNKLDNLIMNAELPENVVWLDNKSLLAGKLRYGKVGRRVVWEIPKVEAFGGEYRAGFEIGIIPEEKDVGKVLELVNSIKYSTTDNFCDDKIIGSLINIDTNIQNDRLASDKGAVISSY